MASKMNMLREDIKSHVIDPVLPEGMIDSETQFFINPTGKFVIGGPMGDCGLTGRKIIVDTYGEWVDMVAAHLAAKIHQKLTVVQLTWRDT